MNALEQLEKIREMSARRDALLRKLERSLAIRALWPDAFAFGACKSTWAGTPTGRTLAGITYALRLKITDGIGNTREFAQDDVPAVLWPHSEKGAL